MPCSNYNASMRSRDTSVMPRRSLRRTTYWVGVMWCGVYRPSCKTRRSALKARRSLVGLQPVSRCTNTMPAVIVRTITDITRRRRGRQTRLREEAREESVYLVEPRGSGGGVVCPVCGRDVSGDEDVVEAHVDACLAYESRRVEMERRVESERRMGRGTEWAMGDGDGLVDVDVDVDGSEGNGGGEDGSIRTRVVALGSLRGTGIHMRTETLDTEDDIDVDGTDDTLFGDAQFGEEDILVLAADGRKGDMEMMDSQVEDSSELDLAILAARKTGDQLGLIAALEAKVKSTHLAPTCRICLSPYTDPTVSTGCWHTCCATCWLKCLGATKLCPLCQRITSASELRRVYL